MKIAFTIISFCLLAVTAFSQEKYFTKTGKINIDATASGSPENIKAVNKNIACVLDTKSGALQFQALMKGFEFERALMQEHFNENYVESDKFPKSDFKGTILNVGLINFTKEGVYPVKVKGKLTIHGVTKDIEADGNLTVKSGSVLLSSQFTLTLSDYNIKIPGIVSGKISKTAIIRLESNLNPLK